MKKFFKEYDDLLFFKYDTYVVFKQFVGAYLKIYTNVNELLVFL